MYETIVYETVAVVGANIPTIIAVFIASCIAGFVMSEGNGIGLDLTFSMFCYFLCLSAMIYMLSPLLFDWFITITQLIVGLVYICSIALLIAFTIKKAEYESLEKEKSEQCQKSIDTHDTHDTERKGKKDGSIYALLLIFITILFFVFSVFNSL